MRSDPVIVPKITRPESLVAKIGAPSTCTGGVVVLGDAAHSFPLAISLELNAGLDDLTVLIRVLDEYRDAETAAELASRYEDGQDADRTALMEIMTDVAPYSMCDTGFRRPVWVFFFVLPDT